MKDGINDYRTLGEFVENLEWEPPYQRPPKVVYYDRIETRVTLDPEHARLYATEKVLAESRLPTLVPMVVRDDVVIGFLRVNNVLNHFEFEHAV